MRGCKWPCPESPPPVDDFEQHIGLRRPQWLTGIATIRTARVVFRCDSCRYEIPAGHRYVRHSLPPGSDIGNDRWWTSKTCGWLTSDCRQYWVVDGRRDNLLDQAFG
jgi:hypothetical protein